MTPDPLPAHSTAAEPSVSDTPDDALVFDLDATQPIDPHGLWE